MAENKINVLIADDSPVVREVLKDMIAGEKDLAVVGEAANGKEAVELAGSLKPDIITMDVIMPVMNGLEAVEEIMAYNPTPIMVFSSVLDNKEMDVAFHAIASGALDVLEKPKVASGDKYDAIREDLLNKLRMLSRIQVIPHLRGKRRKAHRLPASLTTGGEIKSTLLSAEQVRPEEKLPAEEIIPPEPEVIEIEAEVRPVKTPPAKLVKRKLVAVGASTGGPKALVQIFKRMPRDFPLPVLTVQHIAPSFAAGLVGWLGRESAMKVELAQDKQRPLPGTVYIAPTGTHMIVEKGLIRLTESDPVNSCRPSADVLFFSVAEQIGEKSVGVLLTGMGRDGAMGLKAIRENNGSTMVQDEETSVIYGMPRAAVEVGAAEQVLPINGIPDAIIRAITK